MQTIVLMLLTVWSLTFGLLAAVVGLRYAAERHESRVGVAHPTAQRASGFLTLGLAGTALFPWVGLAWDWAR